jgi:CRP/FNR family transcriptional regulator, cyclic AMP receptor protein
MDGNQRSFAAIADGDLLAAIRSAGRKTEFAQSQQIQSAGALHPDAPILLIETGFMSTTATAPGRRRALVSIHGPGDLAGEHGLFDIPSQTYELVMTGMTKGSAWSVQPSRFLQVLHDHPQGWEILTRHQYDRAAADRERIWLMATETAGRRLAVFLLQLLSYNQPPKAPYGQAQWVPLELSQNELAEWIGASRETVARVLKGWVWRGVVQASRRRLFVQDVPMLEKIAGERWDSTARAA